MIIPEAKKFIILQLREGPGIIKINSLLVKKK